MRVVRFTGLLLAFATVLLLLALDGVGVPAGQTSFATLGREEPQIEARAAGPIGYSNDSPQGVVAAVAQRAPELLSQLIRIDTTNPPGDELDAVRFLASTLESEGIASEIFEPSPGRGNLYARLRGNGTKRPIILLSHLDVVPADPRGWDRPPLDGVIEEGAVHGRGALDAKGIAITQLLSLVAIKRLGVPLSRDVILLAVADEETGGRSGAGWITHEKFDLVSGAEFVLNEGGFIRAADGKPLIYNLNAAEKGPCWFRVIATGEPGHASRPAPETAVTRLVGALERLVTWERPYEVGPVVAGYYAAYAVLDEKHARQLRQLERSLEDPDFYAWFMSDPAAAALVRDTLTPTVLQGSSKTNVVPAEALAEIDSRLLPGHDCEEFLADVRRHIGNQSVRVEPMDVAFPSSQSPLANDLTAAVEKLAAEEGQPAVVLPGLQAGFTDSHYFRAKGIASYGFTPIVVTADQRRAVHGPNENVGVEQLKDGIERLTRLLQLVSD
jgi:acetylornithine deacetylase/succinyl-diaminopimelate desuccinylase-like protein